MVSFVALFIGIFNIQMVYSYSQVTDDGNIDEIKLSPCTIFYNTLDPNDFDINNPAVCNSVKEGNPCDCSGSSSFKDLLFDEDDTDPLTLSSHSYFNFTFWLVAKFAASDHFTANGPISFSWYDAGEWINENLSSVNVFDENVRR